MRARFRNFVNFEILIRVVSSINHLYIEIEDDL